MNETKNQAIELIAILFVEIEYDNDSCREILGLRLLITITSENLEELVHS